MTPTWRQKARASRCYDGHKRKCHEVRRRHSVQGVCLPCTPLSLDDLPSCDHVLVAHEPLFYEKSANRDLVDFLNYIAQIVRFVGFQRMMGNASPESTFLCPNAQAVILQQYYLQGGGCNRQSDTPA
jgi:hypothetical protein